MIKSNLNLKSILIFCFVSFSSLAVFAQDEDKTISIIATGRGKSEEEAKKAALKSGMQQIYSLFISSKTELLDNPEVALKITSLDNGSIKSIVILNKSQLPDGSWGLTLKASVSLNKLINFAESKGAAIDFKGNLFALNIKQQILNEKAETNAVNELVSLLRDPLSVAFDYNIKSGIPKSLDQENLNWSIPVTVTALTNKNVDFCANYLINSLSALGLTDKEVSTYLELNKEVFVIIINYKGVEKKVSLRKRNSLEALCEIIQIWKSSANSFFVESGIDVSVRSNTENVRSIGKRNNNVLFFELLNTGLRAATFSWEDKRTLEQIEKIAGYKVYPFSRVRWMKENLKVTKFRNGDPIPEAKSNEEWAKAGKEGNPAWCYYNNDPANGEKYGKLYNWYAVNDPRGLAPSGYHIPSDSKWNILTDFFLGGEGDVRTERFNLFFRGEDSYEMRPEQIGHRGADGDYNNHARSVYFWSSSESGYFTAWNVSLSPLMEKAWRESTVKSCGFSVRCLRD